MRPAMVIHSSDADALFLWEDGRLVPTILTQGPWDPGAQHGGPVCAALAWAAGRVPTLVPMRCARLTVDLLRAHHSADRLFAAVAAVDVAAAITGSGVPVATGASIDDPFTTGDSHE